MEPVPRKNPLPKREIEICARLKLARRMMAYPRRLFANMAGLDSSIIVRLELGRMALRYEAAKKICDSHCINPDWLARGVGTMRAGMKLAANDKLGLNLDALFSEVFDSRILPAITAKNAPVAGSGPRYAVTFEDHVLTLAHDLAVMFLAMNRTEEEISGALVEALKNPLPVPAITINAALIVAENLHRKILAKTGKVQSHVQFTPLSSLVAPGKLLHAHYDHVLKLAAERDDKKDLTANSLKSNNGDVKSELEKLIVRVKRLAKSPGAKAALARFLNVAPARVTEWLNDDPKLRKEPGGRYTLQLLKWVEQQESQNPKALAVLIPPPEPKDPNHES